MAIAMTGKIPCTILRLQTKTTDQHVTALAPLLLQVLHLLKTGVHCLGDVWSVLLGRCLECIAWEMSEVYCLGKMSGARVWSVLLGRCLESIAWEMSGVHCSGDVIPHLWRIFRYMF